MDYRSQAEESQIRRAVRSAFAKRRWPSPDFTPIGVSIGQEVVGLECFVEDFDMAIALCQLYLVEAGVEIHPLRTEPLSQGLRAPSHEYTAFGRGSYPQHISERSG